MILDGLQAILTMTLAQRDTFRQLAGTLEEYVHALREGGNVLTDNAINIGQVLDQLRAANE